MAFLLAAYHEDEVESETRTVLRLDWRSRPIRSRCSRSREDRTRREMSTEVLEAFQPTFMCDYESRSHWASLSPQTRSARPSVTVDFETLNDRAVTVRDRDTPPRCAYRSQSYWRTFARGRRRAVTYDGRGLTFGTVAEQYDTFRPIHRRCGPLQRYLTGKRVLDVGAGTGKLTRSRSSRCDRQRHRTDEEMRKILVRRSPRLRFTGQRRVGSRDDASSTPFFPLGGTGFSA